PTAGAAGMAVLTGPRWRLGAADLAALWRRAVVLAGQRRAETVEEIIAAAADPDSAALAPVLADALADPGAAENYSSEGYRRITACAAELTRLRASLSRPVTDLVADVRRVLGLDAEVIAAGGGTENLDRFDDVVARYADRSGAESLGALGLLAYLDTAAERENGLAPAETGVAAGRVQILTVHAAKGLEWQIVAVPHLSERIFPSTAKWRTWLNDPAQLPPLLRGDNSHLGAHGVPVLDTSEVTDRRALEDVIDAHRDQLRRRAIDEERRLLYVALTRTEDTLLISGHHWAAGDSTPRGPSEFLTEIKGAIETTGCGTVEHWAPAPADGDPNPAGEHTGEALWPVDPLRTRRAAVQRGADLVRAAMTGTLTARGGDADVDALLAERERAAESPQPALPGQLSVSALVELGRDPSAAGRLTRRLPSRPDPHALLGTAFHEWVQRFYGADRLFDLDDLPGEGDTATADAQQLEELQQAFTRSAWASRTPVDVEVPFEMAIGEVIVRGRIDAVFADDDGTVTVVDWKTGEPPRDEEARRHAAVQLAVYRLAWAALAGIPEEQVGAAFHYVRSGRTVTPEVIPGPRELAALLV
ncbi:MAG: ATP-dependent helicase, partial [Mycobacterium sp.]|nr:ATP-dependent helicase [Mycobacterium sp.]